MKEPWIEKHRNRAILDGWYKTDGDYWSKYPPEKENNFYEQNISSKDLIKLILYVTGLVLYFVLMVVYYRYLFC
jgi:hypothetical protein